MEPRQQEVIDVLAVSRKARGRIGKQLRMAIVEQRYPDRIFVSFPHNQYCCWMPPDGGGDWRLIDHD
jgi:hypothetical protein